MADNIAAWQLELEKIRKRHEGLLRPADVVQYASVPTTALHSKFEWDDSEAAQRYRLVQARQLIEVSVRVVPNTNEKTRVYVSMAADRKNGGGYRSLPEVMANPLQKKQLLWEAQRDAASWRRKYQRLAVLAPVFAAMDSVFAEVPDNGERSMLAEVAG